MIKKNICYAVLAVLCMTTAFSSYAAKKTKKLQVILNFENPAFSMFALNAGDGISNDPSAMRPFGSYLLISGLMFPDGTVSKYQNDFTVDKYGNPLQASESIGRWQAFEKILATFDPMSGFPPAGTLLHMSEWGLYFNKECHDAPNNMNCFGTATMQTFALYQPLITWLMNVMPGTGCNTKAQVVKGKLYIGFGGGVLLQLKFDEDIKYD